MEGAGFTVRRPFPGVLSMAEADPFLVLDHLGPTVCGPEEATGATPVWFFVDENKLFLTTEAGSSKGRAMARDPRVVMCVADPNPPFSFVQIQGTATIVEDRDEMAATATRIGEHYLGADSANEFDQSQGVNGEIMVRIAPTKVINSVDLSD